MKKLFFLVSLCLMSSINAREEEEATHVYEGNLALPASQTPTPLFAFGENIVGKGDILLLLFPTYLRGKNKKYLTIVPRFLYGISYTLSFLAYALISKSKLNNECSSGFGDIFLQFEYAFYNKDRPTYADQVTIVANFSIPSGSAKKIPPTGFGSPSFFIGFTASHMATDWYVHTSAGALLTTSHHGTKFGNTYIYQCGICRNLSYSPHRYILSLLLDFDGIYSSRDRINGIIECNSGGNIIFVGPSLWFSTKRLILQAGIEFKVWEHLFGKQNKNHYLAAATIGWKFN